MSRFAWWKLAWVLVAALYAAPVVYFAYGRVVEVGRHAREQLIIEHRLWELHPEYPGTPQAWTRFASRLLTNGQLMRRVRSKYGELANDIELDYQRDLTFAYAEVAGAAAAVWALPMAALYLAGFLATRKRQREQEQPAPSQRPSYSEARYRP